MRIVLSNCSARLTAQLRRTEFIGTRAVLEAETGCASFSPDRRFAVLELRKGRLFAAVRVETADEGELRGEYADHYLFNDDDPILKKLWIEWDCIGWGFCKLVLWAPERAAEFGGCPEHTLHRFYFDRALYERSRKKLHG